MKDRFEIMLEDKYGEILEYAKEFLITPDETRLRAAFEFCLQAHEKQVRRSGEPFAIHPVEVAKIVASLGLDMDSILAAFLHDVLEDTSYDHKDISERFGRTVADLVEGVTKLTRVNYSSKEEQQMENLRKMFIAMARDIRVILVKIADRLHNMRTIEFQPERRRREISLETMEIYAPIAHRLGMQKIKWELEDISLKFLDPVGYKDIVDELSVREEHNTDFLINVKRTIEDKLSEMNLENLAIESRVKHIYSIYRKMMGQHKALFEIYDLYAVRIIVSSITDCYAALGIVHDLFKPLPGRFKDYISMPKPNMYQSLHTTVIGREGQPFEVQLRTWDMHRVAEYGIAAHWKYKDGVEIEQESDEKLEWVRSLLESRQDIEAEEFIRSIKVDMFADEVFVFTPGEDVINLPLGATTIDFAYAIHSAVGNKMSGAKVNGRIVNLEYILQNGDIIEILTNNTRGPSRDWLKIVKTSEARSKIKQWFKKERREENIIAGKADIERELKRAGILPAVIFAEDVLAPALKKMHFSTLDDLYAAIGYGGITPNRAINRLRDELVRLNRASPEKQTPEKALDTKKKRRPVSGIIVEDIDNCLVKFSRCCTPVPGDKVIGYVTRGYGVSVHRADCTNMKGTTLAEMGRMIEVSWSEEIKEKYQVGLQVRARDRAGLVMDVINVLSGDNIKLQAILAKSLPDGVATVNLTVEVSNKDELDSLMIHLRHIQTVTEVARKSIES